MYYIQILQKKDQILTKKKKNNIYNVLNTIYF